MRLRFHPEASSELTDARDWYRDHNGVAAEQFVDEVLRMVESILDAPERWALGRNGVRRVPLRRFPFTIVYRHEPGSESVEIVAVAHQSRRPEYWRHRG